MLLWVSIDSSDKFYWTLSVESAEAFVLFKEYVYETESTLFRMEEDDCLCQHAWSWLGSVPSIVSKQLWNQSSPLEEVTWLVCHQSFTLEEEEKAFNKFQKINLIVAFHSMHLRQLPRILKTFDWVHNSRPHKDNDTYTFLFDSKSWLIVMKIYLQTALFWHLVELVLHFLLHLNSNHYSFCDV